MASSCTVRQTQQVLHVPLLRGEARVGLSQQLGDDWNQVADGLAAACFSCYNSIHAIK